MEIKETKELMTGIKEAVKVGKKIRDIVADGIDATDAPKAFGLVEEQLKKVEIYSAAVKDVSLVKEELKDLSQAELIEIIMDLASAVTEIEKV